MTPSILYAAGADNPPVPLADHRFAVDLNLEQIFDAVNAGREELDLGPSSTLLSASSVM